MDSQDVKPRCGTCQFFEMFKDNFTQGNCMWHPPTMQVMGVGQNGRPMFTRARPTVQTTDWCGQYKPNKGK